MKATDHGALPKWQHAAQEPAARRRSDRLRDLEIAGVIVFACLLFWQLTASSYSSFSTVVSFGHDRSLRFEPVPDNLRAFQDCSIANILATDLRFLDHARPISLSEFISRRDRLAAALVAEQADAFVVEPGYTFSYYANVSQKDWEVWEPEERPFLMVLQPMLKQPEYTVAANITFLVPSFEKARAGLLGMPFEHAIQTVTYEEHWDPYSTLREAAMWAGGQKPRVMVDEEMRDFISRGLSENGFEVVGLGGTVEQVRQRKTAAEVEILRAVNTGTVKALRAMRKCMVPGLTEEGVTKVLDNTLRAAGLDPFFDIVLFDENASNPHGGTNGSKTLTNETMVLIDVGAHLYGYSSDICRSFFPPFSTPPSTSFEYESPSAGMKEKLAVWDTVFEAQTASLEAMHEGNTAAAVDIAARNVIEKAGYGDAFTHRVGHGIGIKAHESPYLHKGNANTELKAGMTFTSEPGVYLVDKFGVRHEDVLLVSEDGMPELLTGRRAGGPWDP